MHAADAGAGLTELTGTSCRLPAGGMSGLTAPRVPTAGQGAADRVNLEVITPCGVHCPKNNQNFRDITRNVEENEILHVIFRVVSSFPRYIS